MLFGVGQDLNYAGRQLRRNSGFASIAIITLALGIGFNAAIFSVLDTVALRPLPFREPDRLLRVWSYELEKGRRESISNLSFPDFLDFSARQQLFEGMGAWCELSPALSGHPDRQALRLQVTAVTHSLLPLVGIEPALGRGFSPHEEQPGGPRAALLSHAFWQSYFAADPDILGRTLLIQGQPYSIVGVLPAWFQGNTAGAGRLPSALTQVWLPYRNSPAVEGIEVRGFRNVSVVARLKPAISPDQAGAEMEALAAHLARQYPVNLGRGAWLQPLHQALVGEVEPTLQLLFGAVGLVLLIACSNLASLMLGRLSARQREIAIRSAIGAGRARIIRQLLTESLLLAALAGVVAVAVAEVSTQLIRAVSPAGIPRLDTLALDTRVLLFLLLASAVSGILFGVLPAFRTARRDPQSGLRQGFQASQASRGSPSRSRLRGTLVVAQLALAALLVIGAGLLLRSFASLLRIDPGFDPRNVLLADLKLPGPFVSPDWPESVSFYQRVLERVEALPGVASASAALLHPMRTGWSNFFKIEGMPTAQSGQAPSAILRPVGPGYFETAGIPVLRGRTFEAGDDARSAGAVIVNQAFVGRFFPSRDPLQQRLRMSHWWRARPDGYRIVGVVGDVRFSGLDSPSLPAMYYPHAQWPVPEMSLLVKTLGDPLLLAEALRREVAALDPRLPVDNLTTLESELSGSLRQRRFVLLLLGSFAITALLLAAVGVYGLLSFLVSTRRAEIGLRLALGASRRDVLLSTLGQALRLVAPGLGLGFLLALLLSRLLANLLYGVSPTDPGTYLASCAFLLSIALLASFFPAARATRVDPIKVLKCE